MKTTASHRILETERLLLRPLTDVQWAEILLTWPDDKAMSFLGLKTPDVLERDRRKARGGFATFNKRLLLFHLIERQSRQVIGSCSFHTWYIDHHRAEIGYDIADESLRGKGYMGEALAAMIAYGFRDMGLQRIEALLAEYNTPSLKLVLKNGFVQEGRLRGHYLVNGVYEDSLVFGLLRSEWEKGT